MNLNLRQDSKIHKNLENLAFKLIKFNNHVKIVSYL